MKIYLDFGVLAAKYGIKRLQQGYFVSNYHQVLAAKYGIKRK